MLVSDIGKQTDYTILTIILYSHVFDKTTILIQAEDPAEAFMRKRLWNIPSSSVLNTSIAAGAGDFLPVAASDGGDYFPTQTYTNVLNKKELENFRNFYHRSFSA